MPCKIIHFVPETASSEHHLSKTQLLDSLHFLEEDVLLNNRNLLYVQQQMKNIAIQINFLRHHVDPVYVQLVEEFLRLADLFSAYDAIALLAPQMLSTLLSKSNESVLAIHLILYRLEIQARLRPDKVAGNENQAEQLFLDSHISEENIIAHGIIWLQNHCTPDHYHSVPSVVTLLYRFRKAFTSQQLISFYNIAGTLELRVLQTNILQWAQRHFRNNPDFQFLLLYAGYLEEKHPDLGSNVKHLRSTIVQLEIILPSTAEENRGLLEPSLGLLFKILYHCLHMGEFKGNEQYKEERQTSLDKAILYQEKTILPAPLTRYFKQHFVYPENEVSFVRSTINQLEDSADENTAFLGMMYARLYELLCSPHFINHKKYDEERDMVFIRPLA